ncbi:TPA: hypothetical protein MYL57_005440 [Klebsiella variicola subsp. variicola]|uniref:hypothetical protein n=1 Tax=Klebsiella variicola TaxID=244366 RepID=UPI00190EE3CB|nr:hypothetical protein [Klebsiella variicola]HCB0645345.1 hypothetical protein [Klebsiella variicola subsp. variicola]
MANETRPNVWEKNNIPAMEYCTLPRAADILNCKICDLIHFAEIGAIEFCIALRDFEVSLFLPFDWRVSSVWEEKFPNLYPTVHKSPLSRFRPKANLNYPVEPLGENITYCYQYKSSPGLKQPLVFVSGLWSLSIINSQISFFRKLNINKEVSLTALDFMLKEADAPHIKNETPDRDEVIFVSPPTEHLYHNDGGLDKSKLKNIATLGLEDIYLTKMQIEKVYNGFGKEIPNYINGEVIRPERELDEKEISTCNVNQNKVGEFIGMLIRCIPELGDDVMNTSANNRHNILMAFLEQKQRDGKFTDMRMPSSATIEKYFKI